jgi:hypothetical protein
MRPHSPAIFVLILFLGIVVGGAKPRPAPTGTSTSQIEDPKRTDDSDDPMVKEARSDTEAVLRDLLTGKLDNDPTLAPVARKLKGFRSWSIERQKIDRDNPKTVKFSGTLKAPQGEATFVASMVKQQNGKWMIGYFQGPDSK